METHAPSRGVFHKSPQYDSFMKKLPSVIYVGMPKSGSTWIYELFRSHESVYVPTIKDIYFFNQEYARGLDWYSSFYDSASDGVTCVDISHDYIFCPDAAYRIRNDISDAKIIICFRNPIQKEFSAYLFGQRNGGNDFSFKEGLNNGYLDPSKCLYGKFLQEYLSVFPRDNLLVLFFDDLESDPQGFAKQLFDFIGVEELHDYPYSRKVLPASRPRLKVIAKLIKLVAVVARRMGLLSFSEWRKEVRLYTSLYILK